RERRIVVDDGVREPCAARARLFQREEERDVLARDLEALVPRVRAQELGGRDEELVDDVEDRQPVELAARRAVVVDERAVRDVERPLVATEAAPDRPPR